MQSFGQAFVGGAPNIIRLPSNPMDKCTICSIAPFPIKDNKLTTFPVLKSIPASANGEIVLLIVPATSWFKEQSDGQPTLEMYVDSKRTADAYITDYINGLVGYIPGIAQPGLFRCYGEWTKVTIHNYVEPETNFKFSELLENARAQQRRWYEELITQSDGLWAQSNGNPLVISREAKIAAEKLNMKDKPWMKNTIAFEMKNCPACGSLVNPAYPVCANCKHVIDKAKAKEIGLAFAEV